MRLAERLRAETPRTWVMGIMNITPDSFFDGGRITNPDMARDAAERMAADGADILDVGGESSRPGAEPVPVEAECARILPVIEKFAPLGVPISVDTYHAETARRALRLGVRMINDISALRHDPEMADVVAEAGCDCVLMHMLGTPRTMQIEPRYDNVVDDICAFFDERISFAVRAGIREEALWLDPGFGFGKTVGHNLAILREFRAFTRFGRPLVAGTSNKSTIGAVLNLPVHDRMEGTAATVAIAIANGASCIRVHDVRAMARVARMSDAIVYGYPT